MNTAQHTPGPWVIMEGDALTNFIYDDLGEDGCMEPIASVSHGDPAELDANTRLIAAAPELLAALQAMFNEHGDFDYTIAMLGNARAAIAKATGSKS